MDATEPLAFGADGADETLTDAGAHVARARARHNEAPVQLAARRVLAILEPLEPEARARVVKATAILLGLELP